MKKCVSVICVLFVLLTCTAMTMKPMSWAYGFVQYKNSTYILSNEKVTQIGTKIGSVKYLLNYETDPFATGRQTS